MHKANTDRDNIVLTALKYKQLGDEIDKAKFHLGVAQQAFEVLEVRCRELEKTTGIRMNFMAS